MLNDFLLSFFYGMPAIVAVATAHDLKTPQARFVMFWGGCLAVILVAFLVIPMMACDGHLMKTHSVCLGGANVANLFNTLAPVTKMAAMIYILGLFPLGILVRFADSYVGRAKPVG